MPDSKQTSRNPETSLESYRSDFKDEINKSDQYQSEEDFNNHSHVNKLLSRNK